MNRVGKMCLAILFISCFVSLFSLPVRAQSGDTKIATEFNFDGLYGGQKLPIGSTIHHFNDGRTEVFDSNNSLILTTSDSESDVVITPEGPMKANHVYNIPSGTTIDHIGNIVKCYLNNQLILTIIDNESSNIKTSVTKQTPLPTVSGWAGGPVEAAVQIKSPDTFNAQWICPSNPPQYASWIVNYLWNGIESPDTQYLVQSVLQWNANSQFPFWSGSAWYCYPGGNFRSTCNYVTSGDRCEGKINYTTYGNWYVQFLDDTKGTQVGIIVSTNISVNGNNAVIFALESYDANWTGIYNYYVPGTTTFNSIILTKNGQNILGNWVPQSYSNSDFHLTNLGVTTSGNTSVTLHTANH